MKSFLKKKQNNKINNEEDKIKIDSLENIEELD
jgi:hypothetical protein